MDIWIEYEENTKHVALADGGDEKIYKEFVVTAVRDQKLRLSSKRVTLNAKKKPAFVYVVVVRYDSGDTFTQTIGNGYIEGAYTRLDYATKLKGLIEKSDGSYEKHKAAKIGRPVQFVPWIGYFESLNNVEIHAMKVL